jgi:hypothetical protein
MSEAEKAPKTVHSLRIELSSLFGEIGFLSFQLETDIPKEIQKLHNKAQDLLKEINKLQIEEDKQQKAIDELKKQSQAKLVKAEIVE